MAKAGALRGEGGGSENELYIGAYGCFMRGMLGYGGVKVKRIYVLGVKFQKFLLNKS